MSEQRTPSWKKPAAPRRNVLLALGWYDYEINRGVAEFAHEANWILNDTAGHAGLETPDWNGDGIITLLSAVHSPRLFSLVKNARVPVVDLDNEHPEFDFPRVVPDNQEIGRLAAEHLLSRGFKQFLYYQAHDSQVERERFAGFQQPVEAAEMTLYHVNVATAAKRWRRPGRRVEYLARELAGLPMPLAAMGQYDGSANEIVLACEKVGLLVPEQVAVVGADNDLITSQLGPVPLTSVDTDRERLGYEGAALLERIMNGEAPPSEPLRIPPRGLVERRSSDVLAVENLNVARALRTIKDHFKQPLHVDDVAEAAAVSRRSLYQLFHRHLGRTVNEEIRRVRIERAKEMLLEGSTKTYAVARETGFSSRENFSRVFQSEVGVSPAKYRRLHKTSTREE